ncbi:hypothetical protein GGI11_008514, partial [Coemansia sp. RSA 2049]
AQAGAPQHPARARLDGRQLARPPSAAGRGSAGDGSGGGADHGSSASRSSGRRRPRSPKRQQQQQRRRRRRIHSQHARARRCQPDAGGQRAAAGDPGKRTGWAAAHGVSGSSAGPDLRSQHGARQADGRRRRELRRRRVEAAAGRVERQAGQRYQRAGRSVLGHGQGRGVPGAAARHEAVAAQPPPRHGAVPARAGCRHQRLPLPLRRALPDPRRRPGARAAVEAGGDGDGLCADQGQLLGAQPGAAHDGRRARRRDAAADAAAAAVAPRAPAVLRSDGQHGSAAGAQLAGRLRRGSATAVSDERSAGVGAHRAVRSAAGWRSCARALAGVACGRRNAARQHRSAQRLQLRRPRPGAHAVARRACCAQRLRPAAAAAADRARVAGHVVGHSAGVARLPAAAEPPHLLLPHARAPAVHGQLHWLCGRAASREPASLRRNRPPRLRAGRAVGAPARRPRRAGAAAGADAHGARHVLQSVRRRRPRRIRRQRRRRAGLGRRAVPRGAARRALVVRQGLHPALPVHGVHG